MVVFPSIATALELGYGMIEIGKSIGSAIKKEDPTLAFRLGTAVGALTANAKNAQLLLRRARKPGPYSRGLIQDAETLLQEILRSLSLLVKLLKQILFHPGILERILGKLKRSI